MDFQNSKLFGVTNKKYLSELLHIEVYKLKDIEKFFTTKPFFSKDKKKRMLYNPPLEYKRVIKRMASMLADIEPPDYVYGGIRNRSYVGNANEHLENDYFLLLDIKNFFPSTSEYYVYTFFKDKLQMSKDIAKICSLLTTEPLPHSKASRHLPQGYSTSPLLSFFSYYDMFFGLKTVANRNNIKFTCYYDDLTFSSRSFISKKFRSHVISIVNSFKLSVNTRKSRLLHNRRGIGVTGTVIKNNRLYVPNQLQLKTVKVYRELTHQFVSQPQDKKRLDNLCNKLQGYIIAVKAVEPDKPTNHFSHKLNEVKEYLRKIN
ncbi:reverse transcriptase family protein [Virgibacillus flavescens]|uniref:reverse transcriptase family protein n=1 Tax=Virgibacillus flavescens TaxID=1611422 RepID=UPI003D33E3E7